MASLEIEDTKVLKHLKRQVEKSLEKQDILFDEWLNSLPKAKLNQEPQGFGPHLSICWQK